MANNTTMTYGSYSFSPVPFVTLNKEYHKSGDTQQIGAIFQVTLTGTLTPLPDNEGGITAIDVLQDALRDAFATEGQLFKVACSGTTLIAAYPRITSVELNPTNNNWVFTTDFTITLEWDDDDNDEDSYSQYISDANEEWTLEFLEEKEHFTWDLDGTPDGNPYILRMTHNVSATGKRHYIADGPTTGQLSKAAWEQAREWVVDRLGYDSTKLGSQGIINIDASDFTAYDHMRTKTINEMGGEFAVSESWVIINPSGSGVPGHALEDFNVTVRTSIEDGLTTVGVEGTIKGLETRDYGTGVGDFDITEDKYAAALDYWNTVSSRLPNRAEKVSSGATSNLNITPRSTVVAHSPPAGTISYTYEYDDRPCNMITGVLTENIQIVDTYPTDVFASIQVLGRARGPILQDLSTVTSSKKQVSIELTMAPPTACATGDICGTLSNWFSTPPTGQVATLLCCIEASITGSYDQVYKTADSQTWNPKNGRYTRQVEWEYVNCSGDAPNTSFC